MTRLVVVDPVLLVVVAAYVVWAARTGGVVPVRKLYSGRVPAWRVWWVGLAVAVVVGVGLFFATGSYGAGAVWVNWLVFVAATVAVRVGVQVVYNRPRAYR